MMRTEAVEEIQEGLGFRGDKSDAIIRRLIRVQTLLEQGRTLPWFLVVRDLPIPVLAGANIPLPDDFIREIEYDKPLWFTPADSTVPAYPQKLGQGEAQRAFSTDTGITRQTPYGYTIEATELVLRPVTTVDTTFYLSYYAKAEVLDSDVENSWLAKAPYLLIGNAGYSFAKTLRNKNAQEEFSELARTAWEALFKETIERQIAGRTFVMGRNS